MDVRSEVEVLTQSPDRGNLTLTRQGRDPEVPGWSTVGIHEGLREDMSGGSHRCAYVPSTSEASTRLRGWVSRPLAVKPDICWDPTRYR